MERPWPAPGLERGLWGGVGVGRRSRTDHAPPRPRPSVPGPPPPGPRPVPPTVPWPQSLRCGPMNGVAFCLVGIPPRPEPRPPQVRARGSGQAGAGPGAMSGLGSLRPRRWAPLRELGVPLGSGRRDSCARQRLAGAAARGSPDGPGATGPGATQAVVVPGPGRPGSRGGRPAPFVRDFQAGRPPPFPLPEFSFSVGEAPAQLEPQGVGEGSWGGTSSARPLRVGLRCGLRGLGTGTPSPARPSSPLPAPAVGGSGSGVPGALLSAGLLCLGSFIYQLLRLGRGPHLPNRVSPLPWSLAAGPAQSPPSPQWQHKLKLYTVWPVVFLDLGKTFPGIQFEG